MQKYTTRPIIVLATLLVIGILGIIYGPLLLQNATKSRAANDASMTFTPTASVTTTVGQTLSPISINISTPSTSTNSIRGVDVSVTFNSNVLELVDINPSAMTTTNLKTFAPVVTTNNVDTFDENTSATSVITCANTGCDTKGITAGTIEFGAVTFNSGIGSTTPAIAPPANFILASLTFKAKAAGTSAIAIKYISSGNTLDSNIVSTDSSGNAIDVLGVTNGPINVTVNSTIVPTATFTPVPPTKTNTPIPPSPTRTNTPIPTRTNTPVPPTPTNTPIVSALCTCQASTNICSDASRNTSCGYVKFSTTQVADIVYGDPTETAVDGAFPLKCNTRSSVAYTTAPTTTDRNNFCQRPLRTKGDADGDGVVTNNDYLYQLRASIGAALPHNINVDFNGDTRVDTDDRAIVVYKRTHPTE